MKKKVFALVLCGVMAFAIGCGSTDQQPTATDQSSSENEAVESDASTSEDTDTDVSSDESDGAVDYSIATSADASEVESFLSKVRSVVSSKDWDSLADLIDYPVLVDGKNYKDKDAFLKFIEENGVSDSFVNDVTGEDCIVNDQGIGMGSGNIWIMDKNFDGEKESGDPDFKIYSINSI